MNRIISSSVFLTGLIYLYDSFSNQRRKINTYFLIFLAIIGSHFLVNELYADEYDDFSAYMEDIHTQRIFTGQAHWVDEPTNPHKKHLDYYKNLSNKHGKKGLKNWKKANSLKIIFPTKDDRERARNLLEAGLTACAVGGTPMSKLVAGVSLLVIMQIGDIMDEWNKFLHYLRKAEYHYALSEFYHEVCEMQRIQENKAGISFQSN